MVAKKHKNIFYIFEKSNGITGIFSGDELKQLENYVHSGVKNEFISRLFFIGILKTGCEEELKCAIENSEIYSPQSLHIDITNVCPLKCSQCYKFDTEHNYMTLDDFNNIITQANDLKVFQIAIGGGEPLIHKDIIDFIKIISKTQMSSSITTSGYGLTPEFLKDLKTYGLNHIQVSLNGSDEKINSLSRDGYEYAINAIEIVSKAKMSFGINFVARRDNLSDFDAIVEIAKKYKANNINILRYKLSVNENYNDIFLDKNDFILLSNKIKKIGGIKIKTDSAFSNLLIHLNNGNVSKNFCGCGASKTFICITSKGTFKPCSHMTLESQQTSIKEYWNTSKDLKKLRCFTDNKSNESNTCFSCIYFEICGGCRAICEGIYNDIWAGEKNCPVYKKTKI